MWFPQDFTADAKVSRMFGQAPAEIVGEFATLNVTDNEHHNGGMCVWCVCMCVCIHVCIHVCIYVCVYMCVYICVLCVEVLEAISSACVSKRLHEGYIRLYISVTPTEFAENPSLPAFYSVLSTNKVEPAA